ncbi:MAG: hypothetical protein Q8918_18935 [Bacteroidota bacterium]|nr:hypothetical protein [Bacteroidota bacterium]MDP4213067.1 hypothetical protein [Bacteroidota bacterium]MDP4252181.1 hypothetical protein [Bacteroidota bacterium]
MPLLAAIVGLVLTIGVSAFSRVHNHKAKPVTTTRYFQFAAVESEANLEIAANWSDLGTTAPGSNPCSPGMTSVCVAAIDDVTLQAQSGSSNAAKFANYLIAQPSSVTYVDNNSTFRKQH